MFKKLRVRKAHEKFLESCRNLKEGRNYWDQSGGFRRWLLQFISPVPVLGLHEEGQRLHAALQWLEKHSTEQALSEQIIRHYHRMISPVGEADGGQYRRHHLNMQALRPAVPEKISALMKHLDQGLTKRQKELDDTKERDECNVLEFALLTYHRIGVIHPFADANGRVARLSLNHIMRRYGLGYVILPRLDESSDLWPPLLQAGQGDIKPLLEYGKGCVRRV